MKTSKRVDGPTPNGGTYMIAYFRDSSGNACSEKDASKVEIVEFESDNNAIARTYGFCESKS